MHTTYSAKHLYILSHLTHQELCMAGPLLSLFYTWWHKVLRSSVTHSVSYNWQNIEWELSPAVLTWEQVVLTRLYCNRVFTHVLFLTSPPKTESSLREGECVFFMFISLAYGTISNRRWMRKNAQISLQNFTWGWSFQRGVIIEIFMLVGETQV